MNQKERAALRLFKIASDRDGDLYLFTLKQRIQIRELAALIAEGDDA